MQIYLQWVGARTMVKFNENEEKTLRNILPTLKIELKNNNSDKINFKY
jgi:hypothetical protein